MEPRLIDANEPYEKIADRLRQLQMMQSGVCIQCIRELANALDIIEESHTITGTNNRKDEDCEQEKM